MFAFVEFKILKLFDSWYFLNNSKLFLLKVAPTTLRTFKTSFTETRRTDTISKCVARPPRPALIKTVTTTLTRNPHKRYCFKLIHV